MLLVAILHKYNKAPLKDQGFLYMDQFLFCSLYYNNHVWECFINLYLTKYKRSLIAKIRSGTLTLAIETGRYSKNPLDNGLCTLCNSKLIEYEK